MSSTSAICTSDTGSISSVCSVISATEPMSFEASTGEDSGKIEWWTGARVSAVSASGSEATSEGNAVSCMLVAVWISVTVRVEKDVAVVVTATVATDCESTLSCGVAVSCGDVACCIVGVMFIERNTTAAPRNKMRKFLLSPSKTKQ